VLHCPQIANMIEDSIPPETSAENSADSAAPSVPEPTSEGRASLPDPSTHADAASTATVRAAIISGAATIITVALTQFGAAYLNSRQADAQFKLEQKKFDFSRQMEKEKSDAEINLEQQKFEASLILKAIETGNPRAAAENLLFLIKAGYVKDRGGKIEEYVSAAPPGRGPVLPRAASSVLSDVIISKDPFGNDVRWRATDSHTVEFMDDWEKKNIVVVEIPELRSVPLLGEHPFNGKVKFNRLASAQLAAAFHEIASAGLLDRVKSWDGVYAPINFRGGKRLSPHALGLAFDINVKENPLGHPAEVGTAGAVDDLVPIFLKYGFKWGGTFAHPEASHFEYSSSKPPDQAPPNSR
jgi:D-alanyl-D-alanine carboxypeptidase